MEIGCKLAEKRFPGGAIVLKDASCFVFVFLISASGAVGLASAQTPLRLLHEGRSQESQRLPQGTGVAVVSHRAQGPRPVSDTVVSREELSRRVLARLEGRTRPVRLTSKGRTSAEFRPTPQSGKVLYVLARAPNGRLYESHVASPNGDTLVPGFAPVQAGELTVRRVPEGVRQRMRSAFKLGTGSSPYRPPATKEQAISESTAGPGRTGVDAGGSADGNYRSATETNLLLVVLAGALGALAGGGGTWYVLAKHLQHARDDRDRLRYALQRQKNKDFRRAARLRGTGDDEERFFSNGVSTRADTEHIRKENDRLERENEALRAEIRKIRKRLQNLSRDDK